MWRNVGYQFYWNMFQDTQRTLALWKYFKTLFCLHMDTWLKFCMCIWITWNNFNQILKVLTIVYSFWRLLNDWRLFILSKKLLNLKILCWKQREFVQFIISLFNKKNIVEKLWSTAYLLHNIDHTLLNIWPTVERLHTFWI